MLKAKFRPPKLSDVVTRPRLIELMTNASKSKSIWVAGAPGSGKTTATLQYLESVGLPYFWYRLDGEDSTPAGFFESARALTEGLNRSKEGLPAFTPVSSENIFRFAQKFFEKLFENWKAPFYCVIDDYPDVQSDSVLHRLVSAAIGCLPPDCHIIVLSRTLPKGDLVRLLVNRDIALIDRDELLFDKNEMEKFLAAHNIADKKEIERISTQANGWIAGVILLLHDKKNIDLKSLPVNSNDHQLLFEYFAREEYDNYSGGLKKILKYTAFIPQFSGEMARKLVDMPEDEIEKFLNKQNKVGYFVERREVEGIMKYQYHPLFRRFLQGICQKEISKENYKKMLLKASQLALADEQLDVAASLMAGAEDWDNLIDFCLKNSADLLAKGRSGELVWWINKIPQEKREANVRLLLVQAQSLFMEKDNSSAEIYHQAFVLAQQGDDWTAKYYSWAGIATTYITDWGDLHRFKSHIDFYYELRKNCPVDINVRVRLQCICALWWMLNWQSLEGYDFDQLEKNSIELLQENSDPSQRLRLCTALIWNYVIRGKTHYTEYVEAMFEQDSMHSSIEPSVLWDANNVRNLYLSIIGKTEEASKATVEAELFASQWGFPKGGAAKFEHIYTRLLTGDFEASEIALAEFEKLSSGRMLESALYQVFYGWLICGKLDFEKAIPILQSAKISCDRAGYNMGIEVCNGLLVIAYTKTQKKEEAKVVFDELQTLSEKSISKHLKFSFLSTNAWLAIENRECIENINIKVRESLSYARENGIVNYFGKINYLLSSIYSYALNANIETEYVERLIGLQRVQPNDLGRTLPNWPWSVRVTTLGDFSISVNNQVLDLTRQSARPLQLLKFLIGRARNPIAVPELIESLWPELDGEKGINNYKVTLSRLRKLIGKDAVIQNDNKLSLSRSHCWVDAWVVQGLVKRTKTQEFWLDEQLNSSHRLLEMYKGAFLPNDSDYWLMSYRNEIHNDYLNLLSAVATGFAEKGNVVVALELGRKGLLVDDSSESIYITMLKAHGKTNQTEAAKNLYLEYERLLKSRYNATPSKAVTDTLLEVIASAG